MNAIVNLESIPNLAILSPVCKGAGKDPLERGNYRGISVTPVILIKMCNIVANIAQALLKMCNIVANIAQALLKMCNIVANIAQALRCVIFVANIEQV